ncbi:PH domain-containing protein [Paenibacillus harenae]|uniref:Membrane protein YdbS with pleckstrin-like domain n=1 Tax=Paenibacillus harenae TaxID=306543 RepID=A0ABT9U7L1_PAEHA|nr:PH domain-containing protein [Paenibacillus harenae]MDQ0115635.1 membrane protein YdbS with pleckstrin-like domain [Paenibacillus harenae]
MNNELTKRLHPDYIKVYRISELIMNGVFLLIIVAYSIVALWKDWTFIPVWISLGLFILSLVLFTWIIPKAKYARFQYELFEDELEIQSGLIFISNVLVPMVRVQHVELESGPLMRKFNLAGVSVVTAATTHKISGLKLEEAQQLKQRIGKLAKVDDQDE